MASGKGYGASENAAGGQQQQPHPSLDIVSASGTQLEGKRIILCISGSVAAYKAIELARLLMRHGSDCVTCVASRAATRLIRPAYLKWATGNDVITDLTGDLEHIRLADYGRSDVIVVYPATANTIGKLANGMDDAPVSTVLTVGFGAGIPIVVCPAMHESMYGNPAVVRNIGFLKKERGVEIVGPQMTEGKAKAPEPEHVLDHIISRFGRPRSSPLAGRRVLIAAGPTVEYIDPVRMITNRSSGATGVLLASELVSAGARVTMVYGPGVREPPPKAAVTRVETSSQMHAAVLGALRGTAFDVVIMAAAVSDFAPAGTRRTKIKSDAVGRAPPPLLRLKRVPKIISAAKRAMPTGAILVGFKAEANVSRAALVRSARGSMKRHGADIVVANDIGEAYQKRPGYNNAVILTKSSEAETGWLKKEAIARIIRNAIEAEVAKKSG